MPQRKRIACWLSDKKMQKLHWSEFSRTCEQYGYELFKLDLNGSLETREPFCVFLHKLTDIIALAHQGDVKSNNIIDKVEKYFESHPDIVVMDPIPNVRNLLNRHTAYRMISSCQFDDFTTPRFCKVTSEDPRDISNQLTQAAVTYPFISKPFLGHGSKQAHQMSIVFHEGGLADCKPPYVAQSFVNHNAVLYKIFVVGSKHHFVERPSLKNFPVGSSDRDTIHFDSSDISKASSKSCLSILDPKDPSKRANLNSDLLGTIATSLRRLFGMDLLGIDVVIDNATGEYAIIDVNAYPGYDGFPEFYDALLQCINNKVNAISTDKNQLEIELK